MKNVLSNLWAFLGMLLVFSACDLANPDQPYIQDTAAWIIDPGNPNTSGGVFGSDSLVVYP